MGDLHLSEKKQRKTRLMGERGDGKRGWRGNCGTVDSLWVLKEVPTWIKNFI